MTKRFDHLLATRRQVLLGAAGAAALATALPVGAIAAEEDTPTTTLKTLDNLFCVYVNRATGRVEFVKTFADVNPEITEGKTANKPYKAPTRNVYIGRASTIFTQDIKRYAIVDFPKRNEGLGFFSQLKDSYYPDEYTHHLLLTLSDRALGGEELGGWALNTATDAQSSTAMDLLLYIHSGMNGRIITDDEEKMAEATRYYTGRELLVPRLYLGQPPKVGALAMIGTDGIQVASTEPVQIALADTGKITGGIAVDGPAANNMSVASKGASEKISAISATVGTAAGVGASSGGSSDTGGGADSSGGSGSSGGSSSGGGASGGQGGGSDGNGGTGGL